MSVGHHACCQDTDMKAISLTCQPFWYFLSHRIYIKYELSHGLQYFLVGKWLLLSVKKSQFYQWEKVFLGLISQPYICSNLELRSPVSSNILSPSWSLIILSTYTIYRDLVKICLRLRWELSTFYMSATSQVTMCDITTITLTTPPQAHTRASVNNQ